MLALTVAATARWNPTQSIYDTDENSTPVMGDEDYAHFLALVEEMAEHALFRSVALFMGLPNEIVDAVVTNNLAGKLSSSPSGLKNAANPFVVRRHSSAPPVDLSRRGDL